MRDCEVDNNRESWIFYLYFVQSFSSVAKCFLSLQQEMCQVD